MRVVYGPEHLGVARIGARVWGVQKNHGVKIDGRPDADKSSLYWYQSKLNVTTYLGRNSCQGQLLTVGVTSGRRIGDKRHKVLQR